MEQSTTNPKCPKCGCIKLLVERRMNGNAKCLDCGAEVPYSECFDEHFEEMQNKERKWFKNRGYSEADMMFADAEFKKYLQNEKQHSDSMPFDKAPGFRRLFMMGYFYGRSKWPIQR